MVTLAPNNVLTWVLQVRRDNRKGVLEKRDDLCLCWEFASLLHQSPI